VLFRSIEFRVVVTLEEAMTMRTGIILAMLVTMTTGVTMVVLVTMTTGVSIVVVVTMTTGIHTPLLVTMTTGIHIPLLVTMTTGIHTLLLVTMTTAIGMMMGITMVGEIGPEVVEGQTVLVEGNMQVKGNGISGRTLVTVLIAQTLVQIPVCPSVLIAQTQVLLVHVEGTEADAIGIEKEVLKCPKWKPSVVTTRATGIHSYFSLNAKLVNFTGRKGRNWTNCWTV
jgi:hypothetical protein